MGHPGSGPSDTRDHRTRTYPAHRSMGLMLRVIPGEVPPFVQVDR